jgi:hypothetical protein
MLFELFQQWYDMTTWQFNLFFRQQVVNDPITLSDVECLAHFILSAFRSWLQARAYEWFRLRPQLHLATHMSVSSSSDDSLLYSIVLTWRPFLGLSLDLGKLQDSLAWHSQFRARYKTWLTSEKT